MTVTAFKRNKAISSKPKRQRADKEYLFIFENSHSLLDAVLFLIRNIATKNLKSSLYSIDYNYCLMIFSKDEKPCFVHIREFCKPFFSSSFTAEYIKEYGKALIERNAVKKLGNVFFK